MLSLGRDYSPTSLQVDLDLSPHTTLAQAGRDYAHNCFHLPGLTLAPGSYIGISGLASAYTEPDTIDVYAVSWVIESKAYDKSR